jgi:hypothetical protein
MPDVYVGEQDTMHGVPAKLPPHRFSWKPKKDKIKSAAEGRDVYADAAWIDIQIDPKSAVSHFATPDELREYARSYEAFVKDSASEGIVGTRLEEWAPMSRSVVEEFRYFKIRTVEDLANIPDARAGEYPQGKDWRARAIAWIQSAKEGAPVAALAAENQKLLARLDAMERQQEQLMKELEKATDPKKG